MTKESTTAIKFAQKVLELTTASWVDPEEFDKFVELVGVKPGEQKVDFFQRFLALLQRLPDKLVDKEIKEKIIEAGQEYLDKAIAEEEELLDE